MPRNIIPNNKIFFHLLLGAVLFISYKLIAPYFSIALLSFIIALLFNPVYKFFFKKTKKKSTLSTTLTVLTILLCLIIPTLIVANMIYIQSKEFATDIETYMDGGDLTMIEFIDNVNSKLDKIPGTDIQVTETQAKEFVLDSSNSIFTFFKENIGNIGSNAINTVTSLFVFSLFLVTFIPNHEKLIKYFKKISPLDNKIDDIYLKRIFAMSKSMVEGTLLIAVVQGVLSGIILWVVGVDYVVFWTIIMIVFGVIPMIGAALISSLIAISLLISGNIIPAIIILIGAVLIGQVDNVMRILLVPKDAKLHPALLLLGFLGGVRAFGALGFLYGPIIMILLVTTLEVYLKYYRSDVRE